MLPSFNTLFIQLLKATAIVSLITVPELTYQAKQILIPTFSVAQTPLILLHGAGDVPDAGDPDHHGDALGRTCCRASARQAAAAADDDVSVSAARAVRWVVRDGLWNWPFAWQILPGLLHGLLVTFEATVLGSVLAYVLGLVFALVRRARVPGAQPGRCGCSSSSFAARRCWCSCTFSTSCSRLCSASRWGRSTTGVIGLGVHYATYTAEVYRAGIDAVPRGQWEAATALNLPRGRTWTA